MNRASSIELRMHHSILENGSRVFPQLFETYSTHLFSCLLRWYKNRLMADLTLAHEAVFDSLKYYSEHSRAFNPEHGSLKKFLEIGADRAMQKIFERENHPLKISSIEHILAKYLDNDRDITLAKMLLKREEDMSPYISLLDLGSCRFKHQQTEIKRHTKRITQVLEQHDLFRGRGQRAKINGQKAMGNGQKGVLIIPV